MTININLRTNQTLSKMNEHNNRKIRCDNKCTAKTTPEVGINQKVCKQSFKTLLMKPWFFPTKKLLFSSLFCNNRKPKKAANDIHLNHGGSLWLPRPRHLGWCWRSPSPSQIQRISQNPHPKRLRYLRTASSPPTPPY